MNWARNIDREEMRRVVAEDMRRDFLAEVTEFFDLLMPPLAQGEAIELRLISPAKKGAQPRWVDSGAQAAQIAWEHRDTHHVYFGVAPRVEGHGSQRDVTRIACLWLDIDAKCFADGKQGAAAALDECPLSPSAVVNTGNGFHAYWLLHRALPASEVGADARRAMRSLRAWFDKRAQQRLDSVDDLSRILRVPSTLNHKSKPPLDVWLIESDDGPPLRRARYDLSDFRDVSSSPEPDIPQTGLQNASTAHTAPPPKLPDVHDKLTLLWRGEVGDAGFRSQSEADAALVAMLARMTPDRNNIDRFFRLSGLMRDKWDEQRSGDGRTYGQMTLDLILKDSANVALPPALTCAEIASLPVPTDLWLVDGVIKLGGHNLITGARASGKSWAVLDLEIAVATGRDWFGRKTVQSAVLHVDEDASLEQFQRRVPMLARARGVEWTNIPISAFALVGVDLYSEAWVEHLIATIRERDIGLVVFETARTFLDGDENVSRDVEALHKPLSVIRRETQVTDVLTHHVARNRQSTSRGSGVWEDRADSALKFEELGARGSHILRVEHTKAKWGDYIRPTRLRLDLTENTAVMRLDDDGESDDVADDSKLVHAGRFVLSDLALYPDGCSRHALFTRGTTEGHAEATLRRALKQLERERKVVRHPHGREVWFALSESNLS
jgi:hypothetical protein